MATNARDDADTPLMVVAARHNNGSLSHGAPGGPTVAFDAGLLFEK